MNSNDRGGHMSDVEQLKLIRAYLAVTRAHATRQQVSAWDNLVNACNPAITRVFRRCEYQWDVVEDLRQDVWLIAVRKLSTPKGPDPARGTVRQWILGIARRIARNHGRRRLHDRTEPLSTELVEALLDVAGDPSIACASVDDFDRLRALIERFSKRLSPVNRRILLMRSLGGLPVASIAALTDLSVGAVKLRLHDLYEDLRDYLRRQGLGLRKGISEKKPEFT
jgi:RNA polymerase sigma factor (sigma-70 family)